MTSNPGGVAGTLNVREAEKYDFTERSVLAISRSEAYSREKKETKPLGGTGMSFTLASESARRVSLLRGVGYDFDTKTSGFPEVSLESPKATVEANAKGKALAVSKGTDGVVLGADTVVFSPDGDVLGQAGDEDEVRRMLSSLHGRVHEVHSGVAVARGDAVVVRHSVTRVRMRSLSEGEIAAYVRLGEGVGKAGGYAIQGKAALFVEWVGGDYTNVVGLPLALTCRMLEEYGVRWH